MLSSAFYLLLVNLCLDGVASSHLPKHKWDVGEPLMLTEYLDSNRIRDGQEAAQVPPLTGNIKSYAGFFTVNKTYNSNMYFWYFPSESDPENAPVLVWLQGGPGGSSLYGLFEEHGPYYLTKSNELKIRKTYWSQTHHVIYIDNPVGTGFSFSEDAGYSTNEVEVGENLYRVVYQFFKLFPNLQKNDFFVTGESYAGKYVPALSFAIHKNNPTADMKINLQGLAIGDGLCDPEHMLGYGNYLYEIGLIDDNQKAKFNEIQDEIVSDIKAEKWTDAFKVFDRLLNGDLTPYKTLLFNATGFSFYFNYLYNTDNEPYGDMNSFLESPQVRKAIHVGNLTYHTDTKVEMIIKDDMMQSVAPWVSVLVDNYRVLFYNGQLDIIVAYPLTLNFLKHLDWCGAEEFKTAKRTLWTVDGELAGYSKLVAPSGCRGSITEVLVRNAGHMVPQDQPVWAMDLITKFTRNQPL